MCSQHQHCIYTMGRDVNVIILVLYRLQRFVKFFLTAFVIIFCSSLVLFCFSGYQGSIFAHFNFNSSSGKDTQAFQHYWLHWHGILSWLLACIGAQLYTSNDWWECVKFVFVKSLWVYRWNRLNTYLCIFFLDPLMEPYPHQFATALFSFLYHLASYDAGGEALVSCGMMEALLKV